MAYFKLPSWFIRLAISYAKIVASIVIPPRETILPASVRRRMMVVPLQYDELFIDDLYLHVSVAPDTYTLSVKEFSLLCRPKASRHQYMPHLVGFFAKDSATRKVSFIHVESVGLDPLMRENFHRVFSSTDEARYAICRIVNHNDLAGYFSLIRETFSSREYEIWVESAASRKKSRGIPKPAVHEKKNGKEIPPAPPPQ